MAIGKAHLTLQVDKIVNNFNSERTIAETEGAYSKILETSHTLLNNVKMQMTKGANKVKPSY